MFNEPLDFATLSKLSHKTFAEDTMKNINWVTNMFNEWREVRNSNPEMEYMHADLDAVSTLTVKNLSYAICRFITEIRKPDGSEFPGKTMYEIVICIQFYLETRGFAWKIVDDEKFRVVKYTLDNLVFWVQAIRNNS